MPFAGSQHAPSRISPTEGPTEARLFRGALSPSGWTFRGGRNRVILLVSGTGRMQLGGVETSLTAPALVWAPAGEKGSVLLDAGAEGAALAVPELALGSAMPAGALFAEVRDAIAGVLNTPAENVTAEQPGPQTEIGAVTVKAQGTYQSLPIVSYSLSLPCECGFSFWAVGFDAPEEDVAKVFADDLKAARQRVKEVLQGEGDGLEIGIERNTQAPGAPTQLYCAWST